MPSASYPSLAGKGVYVTGGATGIGAEMVRAFSRQGAKVAFMDLDEAAGAALAASIARGGGAVRFRVLDATDPEMLQADIRDAAENMGRLDVLINNVANDTRHSPLDFTPNQWRKALAINLDAAFFASQAAIPLLSRQERSAIINLSSINALLGPASMPAYVAAKAGLIGLTKALAREFGPKNIRVNAILPGWIVTERQLQLWLKPEAEAEWAKLVCLPGRITEADIAAMALFLGADDSAMITGQDFVVDAGRT